jgi:hypothetical protein
MILAYNKYNPDGLIWNEVCLKTCPTVPHIQQDSPHVIFLLQDCTNSWL